MPVSPNHPVPSARGQSHDGSGGDATGFGSLLGGLDADAQDGGTAGQASSGASGPPAQHGGSPPATEGSAAASPNGPGKSDKGAASSPDVEPAKAAGPAKAAAQAKGDAGHPLAGKGAPLGKPGKLAPRDAEAVTDPNAAAAAASATLLAAATVPAAATEAASIPEAALAAAANSPAATGPAAAAPVAAPADAASDALQTIASALTAGPTADQSAAVPAISAQPIESGASPAPALPAVDAAPLAAPSAFGNAVLEATLQVSPLTGNATMPEATPPSIAASLLAAVKTSSGGGAPAPALSPTAPGQQSVVAPPSLPIQLLAPLPQPSAAPTVSDAPAAAAAPQASIAPAIAAAISLLSEGVGDAGRIVIRGLPRGVDTAALHNGRAAASLPAGGVPAASFGNALFPGGIPALAAALLGNSEDQTSDLADGLLQSGKHELAADASPTAADKAAGESEALTASSDEPGLPAPSFAAALAHTQSTSPSGGTESARPAAPSAPTPMPPMPALQIMPSLTKAAGDGGGRFNIQLHPQELGRVRVELDIDHDGHVTAAISAAHPATLDLLRRDAAALQQALNDAGLKTDGNALSFNLQSNGQDMADGSGRSSRSGAPVVPPAVDPLEDAAPKSSGAVSLGAGLVAVDIRI